jgi:type II secretory pathway pseudopilin PulG
MKKTLKGFTLIELGIVVFSLSILVGIIVPNLQRYIEQAEMASDYANGALIYDDISLIIASDDYAYHSFYAGENDGSSTKTCQYPQIKMVKVGDEYIQTWTKDTKYTTSIVTRCSGVNYNTMMALAKRQGQGYDAQREVQDSQNLTYNRTNSNYWHGLHDPFGGDGYSILFTWEPVSDNKEMNKTKIMENVGAYHFGWGQYATGEKTIKNGKEVDVMADSDKHKYFTLLLCEKENLPLWSDYAGNSSSAKSKDKAVTSKVPIQMRYNKGNKNPDKGEGKATDGKIVTYQFSQSDYVWEWMITYNPDTLEPEVWAGNGQGNLVRKVYPDVTSDDVLTQW